MVLVIIPNVNGLLTLSIDVCIAVLITSRLSRNICFLLSSLILQVHCGQLPLMTLQMKFLRVIGFRTLRDCMREGRRSWLIGSCISSFV